MQTFPKWATPQRRGHLVKLWRQYGNRCLLGHPTCPVQEHYLHHKLKVEVAFLPITITDKDSPFMPKDMWVHTWGKRKVVVDTTEWVGGAYFLREEAAVAEWKADDREERAYLRKLEQERFHPTEHIRQGGFDSIARDIFLSAQPSHYVEGQSIDVLRQQPVALVRVASSPVRLWVDMPSKPSKHAQRKAKWLRKQGVIEQAVSDYHNS